MLCSGQGRTSAHRPGDREFEVAKCLRLDWGVTTATSSPATIALVRAVRRLAESVATPLLPADYLDLVALAARYSSTSRPSRIGDCRNAARRDDRDSSRSILEGAPARTVHTHRDRRRRGTPLAGLFTDVAEHGSEGNSPEQCPKEIHMLIPSRDRQGREARSRRVPGIV
jgi:hypothetical protein